MTNLPRVCRTAIPTIAVAVALLAGVAGCGRNVDACKKWREATCRRFGECLGTGDKDVASCLADGDRQEGTCEDVVGRLPGGCDDSFAEGMDQCAANMPTRACSELCPMSGGFQLCSTTCFYFCK